MQNLNDFGPEASLALAAALEKMTGMQSLDLVSGARWDAGNGQLIRVNGRTSIQIRLDLIAKLVAKSERGD